MLDARKTISTDAKKYCQFEPPNLFQAKFTLYSRSKMFYKKHVLKNFLRPATLLKKTPTLVWELREIFKNPFFFLEQLQLLLLIYTYEDTVLSSYFLVLKKKEVMRGDMRSKLHSCSYDIFLLNLWRKSLVQSFAVFWSYF